MSLNSSCFSCGNGDKSYRMAGAPSARQTLSICAGEDIGVFTIQSNQIRRVANFIKAGVQSVENHRFAGNHIEFERPVFKRVRRNIVGDISITHRRLLRPPETSIRRNYPSLCMRILIEIQNESAPHGLLPNNCRWVNKRLMAK